MLIRQKSTILFIELPKDDKGNKKFVSNYAKHCRPAIPNGKKIILKPA